MTIKETSFVLASHREWKIWADFETITLENPAGQRWEIGDMYGNPQAGLVTCDEKYAVVIGCGVMIADSNRFGEVITGSSSWLETPVVHSLCQPSPPGVWPAPHEWHFETVYEADVSKVRLVADLDSDYGGIYEMRLPDLALKPVLVGSIKTDELD